MSYVESLLLYGRLMKYVVQKIDVHVTTAIEIASDVRQKECQLSGKVDAVSERNVFMGCRLVPENK
jgi:hypothetical protein